MERSRSFEARALGARAPQDDGRGLAARHRPYSLLGPGQAGIANSNSPKMRGAERRETRGPCDRTSERLSASRPRRLRGVPFPPCDRRKGASRRSVCGDFWLRARSSGLGLAGPKTVLIRRAFALLHPNRVQPSKAAPPSGGGRGPKASRARGDEPRPRAPHPAPPLRCHPEDAPR
jgi:hypothetical protein